MITHRLVLLFAAGALAFAVPCAAQGLRQQAKPAQADTHARRHAESDLTSLRLERDPTAPVHLVMSRRTYEQMPDLVRGGMAKRDSIGAPLMMVEIQARQLSGISERIHQRERRCGGYFAFASRADAEAFLRNDLSLSTKKRPAVPIRYTIDNAATVSPWLDQVQHANIHATITHLSNYQNRYYASTYGRQAAEWIQTTWMGLAAGRSDVTSELFACNNCSTQPSVILTIRGREIPNEVVVLGGHLDSININGGGVSQRAPGADDDASGIATLTEILRIAMASGWKPRRTVKFMGYAAEEVGLRGSNAIAQAHRAAHVNVVAVLQFDMTNYRASTSADMRLVTDYSNLHLQTFLNSLFDTYLAPRGLTRGFDTCGYACSDHASWTAAGYPSGFFFEGGSADGRAFPYIHTTSDTLANMGNSAQHSGKFAMLGLAFLGEAAKTSGLDTFPTSAAAPPR
jgi:bacterial leucyl aminopeptidase